METNTKETGSVRLVLNPFADPVEYSVVGSQGETIVTNCVSKAMLYVQLGTAQLNGLIPIEQADALRAEVEVLGLAPNHEAVMRAALATVDKGREGQLLREALDQLRDVLLPERVAPCIRECIPFPMPHVHVHYCDEFDAKTASGQCFSVKALVEELDKLLLFRLISAQEHADLTAQSQNFGLPAENIPDQEEPAQPSFGGAFPFADDGLLEMLLGGVGQHGLIVMVLPSRLGDADSSEQFGGTHSDLPPS